MSRKKAHTQLRSANHQKPERSSGFEMEWLQTPARHLVVEEDS